MQYGQGQQYFLGNIPSWWSGQGRSIASTVSHADQLRSQVCAYVQCLESCAYAHVFRGQQAAQRTAHSWLGAAHPKLQRLSANVGACGTSFGVSGRKRRLWHYLSAWSMYDDLHANNSQHSHQHRRNTIPNPGPSQVNAPAACQSICTVMKSGHHQRTGMLCLRIGGACPHLAVLQSCSTARLKDEDSR